MTADFRPHPARHASSPVPTWAATFLHACRQHLGDVAVIVLTLLFVTAGGLVGLYVLHRAH